ncbi:hypothetical protein IG631_17149 [Alternaria alternata]|nr:hypothetical protein IG631_17149 [Alternaria alternata]
MSLEVFLGNGELLNTFTQTMDACPGHLCVGCQFLRSIPRIRKCLIVVVLSTSEIVRQGHGGRVSLHGSVRSITLA